MKIQYLGDSKDSFKWDYHDYLVNALKFPTLKVIYMMTSPDDTSEGKTPPTLFGARSGVISLCENLRQNRDPQSVKLLPTNTNSDYSVVIHAPINLHKDNRESYFFGVSSDSHQLVYLDPDVGFEPEKSFNEKHLRYAEIWDILEQLSEESIISIFQHFRYIPYTKDFSRIKERLGKLNATAIYWHSVMFVAISKSKKSISRVMSANSSYMKLHPSLKAIP